MGVREHLMAIRKQHGQLTPEIVVQEATPEEHPLHAHFEWDDTVAAAAWRREQARQMIRSVRVSHHKPGDGQSVSVRAFHAVRSERGTVFEPAEVVAQDPFLLRLVLADMRREWEQLKRRYEGFAEFAEMIRQDPDVA